MKYLYWIGVVVVLVSGIALSVYFGVGSKTLPKITPSYFDQEAGMAQAIAQRLRLEIMAAPVLFLGVEDGRPEQVQLWKDFYQTTAQDPQLAYQYVIIDSELKENIAEGVFPGSLFMSVNEETQRLNEIIKETQSKKQRVLVITPNIFATGLLTAGPIQRLRSEFSSPEAAVKITGFTTAFLPASEADFKQMIPCSTNPNDRLGTGKLGCLIQQKFKTIRRKLQFKRNFTALMDLIGQDDYLVLIRKN